RDRDRCARRRPRAASRGGWADRGDRWLRRRRLPARRAGARRASGLAFGLASAREPRGPQAADRRARRRAPRRAGPPRARDPRAARARLRGALRCGRAVRVSRERRGPPAAAEPHEGVNALDGLLLGWNALSALRLTIRSDSRVHGIITDGGKAANIIPDHAAARLMVRSPDNTYLADLKRRVLACFEGAAQATGCELRAEWSEVCEVVTTNRPLAEAFTANAKSLGRTLHPRRAADTHGSTDMGNVTTIAPGIHPFLSITDVPIPWHSVAFA